MNKRIAIYAHFDARGQVKRYVLHSLRRLREECDEVHFVSTAKLSPLELAKVDDFCATAIVKDNVGYDFAMWQAVLLRPGVLDGVDELVLTNSSCFGPLRSLRESFTTMTDRDCDFWGMTESLQISWHLQSYFLVFKKTTLAHPAFLRFWRGVLPLRDKDQVIRSYEIGLSTWLKTEGMRASALVSWESLGMIAGTRRTPPRPITNPASCLPLECLARGMPLVKVEIFRDNPARTPLGALKQAMADRGYDLSLIELDTSAERASA